MDTHIEYSRTLRLIVAQLDGRLRGLSYWGTTCMRRSQKLGWLDVVCRLLGVLVTSLERSRRV